MWSSAAFYSGTTYTGTQSTSGTANTPVKVGGDVTINGNQTVGGKITANGSLAVIGSLTVNGTAVSGGSGTLTKKIDWINLTGSNYLTTGVSAPGTGASLAQICVDELGNTRMRGSLTLNTAVSSGGNIMTLPPQYYNNGRIIPFPIILSNGTVATMYVNGVNNGSVNSFGNLASGVTFYLDSCNFQQSG